MLVTLSHPSLQLPQLFSSSRSCTLVKSSVSSGSDCFSEPECRQECSPTLPSINQQRCLTQPSSDCFVQQCRTVSRAGQCSQLSQQQCSIVYDVR